LQVKTTIIAEAGVNHNGDIGIAKRLIDVAANAGADMIKFQTFKAEKLVTKNAEKANYQKKLTGKKESQFQMIKKLELDWNAHKELNNYCKQKKIQFLSTAFDHSSIDLLAKMDLPFYKIPSGEITNLPYLRHIGYMGKPIVMSTGMANMDEVKVAMKVLLKAGVNKDNLIILHCNTEYPTPIIDVNLRAMLTIQEQLDVKVGYSDHTLGIEVAVAAVAMGACLIEKHLTLDKSLSGPDHSASLEPHEFISMVQAIRNIEKSMGSGIKTPSQSEKKNISVARKSIVAKKPIKKGELFSENNLTVKRPGTGISPMMWDNILGNIADRNYKVDDLIK